jgi:nickel-dependent lactate racemase
MTKDEAQRCRWTSYEAVIVDIPKNLFPHPMNGYGGGPKIIFPAVSNYDAIREHHLANTIHPGSIFGNLHANPFYD